MRKTCSVLLGLAMMAGCATTNTNLSKIPSVSGVYHVVTVEGAALPHTVTIGALEGREVLKSTLTLNADKTFELGMTMRVQMSSLEPFTFEREFTGTYEPSQIGVQLNWNEGAVTSAAFIGKTLKFYFDGVEFIFAK